ncbi:helix-turn-helix transcriptional regulator [Microbacterium sp. KHB019]|uniref:helix-turn-helix transcriptional regulator n=1 Tax=Microbacterium sp. KHB019 TaxID=3129770 RepID=UPI00307B0524
MPAPVAARQDALERLLGDLTIRIRSQIRVLASADEVIALEPDALSVIYVIAGDVHLPTGAAHPDALSSGDVLLVSGQSPLTLRVPTGAGVLVSRLALADEAAHLRALLPDIAWIRRFDELEPAAAALAQHIGVEGAIHSPERDGDLVICRMMATTLLQSVIRAWSTIGCAPEGWPSRTGDAFLDRVVEAIHQEPGREWTVEMLAGIGAMSRSVFASRFHTTLGRSPASYVTEVRMESAKRMLEAGSSVSDTSRRLGYNSDEGFSRAFRKATGVAPSRWRQRGRTPVSA